MTHTSSRHHADWLSLLEISGPFLSLPVLLGAFPQGLDVLEPEQARSLRADYEFWQENANDPAVHTAWVKLVLDSLLAYPPEVLLNGQAIPAGLKAEFPEHEETLRPDFVLVESQMSKVEGGDFGLSTFDRGARSPHLLIQVFPPSQSLEKAVAGSRWQASAATRMMELLHASEIRLGLLTNGEQWMLVDAPRGETTGFTTWYAGLWFDEPLTLRAFFSLLGVRRFFGVPEDETLAALLTASAKDQHEVTDQLGLQVRRAVEILIQMLDRADQDRGGSLFRGAEVGAQGLAPLQTISPNLLYEAALTIMMRLVFLLSAEERKLLPLDDPLYAQYYAVSTLRAQLRELADLYGEEVLERRYDAWSRLLATFRAVHGGIRHDRLSLPPYGGSLFDPDKYPFLEGRTVNTTETQSSQREKDKLRDLRVSVVKKEIPLPIDNRTVLHLLDALQMLQVDVPGGGREARRLSFRALDVEQIGHVYEGLLDHHAVRADQPVLGLKGAKRQEPEIPLAALEAARRKSEADLLKFLQAETGRSASALQNSLDAELAPGEINSLRAACGNDERLLERLRPFAGLVRQDDFGFPVVILAGSVYVTAGTTRRATGTHYTPRSLTEPVVQHTLEPLVYVGPAEGLPRAEWRLKTPAELLDLKICDMAMGSGGFLVQVVRYMGERLVEAWGVESSEKQEMSEKALLVSHFSSLPPEDRLTHARRLVAERCLYGVDKNPLAVEIAKLSLWLVTLAKDLPFTFLDHALKCGDSLVGASEDDFLRWAHGDKTPAATLFDEQLAGQLETARQKRGELEGFAVRDVQDAARKTALLAEAEAALTHIRLGCDLLTGARLLGLKPKETEDLQLNLLFPYIAGELDGPIDPAKHPDAAKALATARKERIFHWEFEFPEVFEKGGFSAFVGNPPFIGGQRISGEYGVVYRDFLVEQIANGHRGSADLCAYFFLRIFNLQQVRGALGLIATNTIAQGDTREIGLNNIVNKGGVIYCAITSAPWPGTAAVSVSIVFIHKGEFLGQKILNEHKVDQITPMLDSAETKTPYRLNANIGKSFQGSNILGMGFLMAENEANELIKKDIKNKIVLFPFLNGEDLNSDPIQAPSRWVINFFDWSLEKSSNYPDCMEIVRNKVYPERQRNNDKNRRELWWRFTRPTLELYKTISTQKRTLVAAQTSKYLSVSFQPTNYVFSHTTIVIALETSAEFALLTSGFHEAWVRKYASTLETRLRYIPTDCFENFPFPQDLSGLEQIGETYHETRRQIMLARQEGLTATYNRFHNPAEKASDIGDASIVHLRRLHIEMDQAVAAAYGWQDLELGHDFHETAQGVRFTISEAARREVLSRLLRLNHERYEEEQREGEKRETGKKGAREKRGEKQETRKKGKKSPAGQMGLF